MVAGAGAPAGIDRRELVTRHDVRRSRPDPLEPLSVGNGELAFTVDVTGLQTIPNFHQAGMRLGTQAQWAWHSAPNPRGFGPRDCDEIYRTPSGRPAPYPTTGRGYVDKTLGRRGDPPEHADAWLRENPHRLDLGRIGLVRTDGRPVTVDQLGAIAQRLHLWEGRIESTFGLDGVPVRVRTAVHPGLDAVAVRVESALLAEDRVALALRFPYAAGDWEDPCVWDAPDRHHTDDRTGVGDDAVDRDRDDARGGPARARRDLVRTLDADRHHVAAQWSGGRWQRRGPHEFWVRADREVLELVVGFAAGPLPALPTVAQVLAAAAGHWARFWTAGGAVELSGSTDPRAGELERRVVLSQYLSAVHCAGSTPPAETGLVTNSWRGKFHLEMHWWHAAHFPLWGRPELLERSLDWYLRILPVARECARRQGYRGARWPKQVGPEARESPSHIGPFLVWQQPHPISLAELLRRARGDPATLARLAPLVEETADFLASFPAPLHGPGPAGTLSLGPPLASAQEKAARQRRVARDPTFELAYWRWALGVAQEWRHRRGLAPDPRYDAVARRLAPLPVRDGRYAELTHPPTRDEGHPSMVGALGLVPDTGVVDREVMRATLRHVLASWDLRDTWGWDYPLLAMTACRLGEPELAVHALLLPTPRTPTWRTATTCRRPPGWRCTCPATVACSTRWR